MKCPKCGGLNPPENSFCVHCGAKLSKEPVYQGTEPAHQLGEMGGKVNLVLKKLTFKEKIVGVGAILGLISFFLPWLVLSNDLAKSLDVSEKITSRDFGDWTYLLPIFMLVILVFLYFSIGATSKVKIKYHSYFIVIGTVFATIGVMMSRFQNGFFGNVIKPAESVVAEKELLSLGNGIWLLIIGSLAIIIGAILVQRENLKD
jgi:hypothetical protein